MKVCLYSVFDRGVSAFGNPIQAQNELMMRRTVTDMFLFEAGKPPLERHQYVRWPDSYDVYFVGEFENDTGAISPVAPVLVFRMSDFAANAAKEA